MHQANINEAEAHLSTLIDAVLAGEDVIISRCGKPLVRLIPYKDVPKNRTPGGWEGQVVIAEDFNEEFEEVNAIFYGESE